MSSTPVARSESGFWSLALLQFQGAFSDNVFKMMLMLYVATVFKETPQEVGKMNAVIQGLFPVAYLTFSCWAGFLADKYSKRDMTLVTKFAEVVIMAIGAWVWWMGASTPGAVASAMWMAVAVLFLMFVQSAFFSPSKYGIIPELVTEGRLAWANGVIGLLTYLAIIGGLAVTTELFGKLGVDRLHWISIGLVVLAGLGFLAGMMIPRTPRANPDRPIEFNFFPELMRYFRILWKDPILRLVVLGLAYFWGLGAMLLSHVIPWGQASLGLDEIGAGRLYLLLALGIGLGSAVAGWASRKRIEPGLIPIGAVGLGLFALPLAGAMPGNRVSMVVCLFMLGLSGGFFSVPLNALLQARTSLSDRGGLLAANNYITDFAILFSAVALFALNALGVTPNRIFLIVGLVTLAGTVIILYLTPEILLRFVGFLLTRTLYRIRVIGGEHLPAAGPALLVSNHVSYIDALLIMAVCPRPVRFIAWEGNFEKPWLGWALRAMRTIPIASDQKPRELIRSMRTAQQALKDGEIVCIFAEGQVTRTGLMQPFRRGFEFIVKDTGAPVVPICLDGVWGSIFSFSGGKFLWKRPKQIPYPVRVVFGAPLPTDVETWQLRQVIEELGAEGAIAAGPETPPLHHTWIRTARRHWKLFSMEDTLSPPSALGRTVLRTVILARRLRPAWAGQETVGVMLPPSVGGALVNFAAALTGRTVVNLNYTLNQAVLDHCIAQAGLKSVVTARAFMEKLGDRLALDGVETIYLEDYRGLRGFGEVAVAFLAARLMPVRLLEKFCGAVRRPTWQTPATIIFSSGSTGTPKGIVLSHFNVAANVGSFSRAINIYPHDRMLGVLPFFHSFGYTVTMWGAVQLPFGAVFHNNPLDLKTVGELLEKRGVTLVVSTPTFMTHYIKRIPPQQFGGVQVVVSGAERLPDSTREAFKERFGVEPLQGYGTTECAPVVSVNVDDFRSPGLYQVGHKRGSVGHPLPGIAVRTIDPQSGVMTPPGVPGLLWVRGANLMLGYLGMPEKTAEVLQGGWYNTGDMAILDEDGFIFITGRLSRFSKIGGEMVPHVGVEEQLRAALALEEDEGLAVAGVPDEKKGEQLVVLHTLADARLERLGERLTDAGLPNLWVPRRENWFRIEAMPVLGTGKLDLKALGELAAALVAARRAPAEGNTE